MFLEDTELLAAKNQQTKLAGRGRLSASIAHEIRNPVGAMSHAAQLLGESTSLSDEDKRLTEIIRTNGDRVRQIIENVMSMARRENSRPERLILADWLTGFRDEFSALPNVTVLHHATVVEVVSSGEPPIVERVEVASARDRRFPSLSRNWSPKRRSNRIPSPHRSRTATCSMRPTLERRPLRPRRPPGR